MKHTAIKIEDDRPILEWVTFKSEILKFYEAHKDSIPELHVAEPDWDNAADVIFEQLIYDYCMCKKEGVVEQLNYKLAEA
tara:strand:- start:375 stop:614 length:240 start_codon:yes stop_codon:yes gene_type:complete